MLNMQTFYNQNMFQSNFAISTDMIWGSLENKQI